MIWSAVAQIFSILIELIHIGRMSDFDKDLEIMVLQYQLGIADRKLNRTIKPNRIEKLTLAVLVNRMKSVANRSTNELRSSLRLFSPRTIFRWHNELVKRKWTYNQNNKGGRPKLSQEIQDLVARLAKENPRWGYGKIEGELLKLGIKVSQTTIRNILNWHGIVPAPVRAGSLGWQHLMNHYKSQPLACDFLTVETLFLKTINIFFFLEVGTRRVHIAGITEHPDGHWVAQQARNFGWFLQECDTNFVCLIRDNDSKYTDSFDTVFESEGINIVCTPFKAPNANSFAERWVKTLRVECLDTFCVNIA